jgi:protein O-mannosyl-transferase
MTETQHHGAPQGFNAGRWVFHPIISAALLVFLAVVAYFPALSGGFVWDDNDYVTENQALRDLDGLRHIWFDVHATPQYYPLVQTSFWLEYHAWGLNPLGYHFVNLLLHALATALLWRVLAGFRIRGAWLAAALFALHPVAVESVAWITERKNVLSAVFYFASALAFFRFSGMSGAEDAGGRRWRWYGAAMLLFIGALLSKTVTCSLPAALLLVLWWKEGTIRRADALPLIPFFVIGATLGIVTVWVEKYHVGAQGGQWAMTFLERCLIAGRAVWFYVWKLLLPVNLTFIYPRWQVSTGVWWQWLFPIAATGSAVTLWLVRSRIGRGPLAAALFFVGTLFPALGFFDVFPMRYSFVADHFQYLACVGLIVLAAAGLSRLPRFVSAGLLILLGVLTWRQAHIYHDLETLWRDTLQKNPACWLAHNNLGVVLERRGKAGAAEPHFRKAVELNPSFAQALSSLGANLCGQGKVDEGMDFFRRAVEVEPSYANAWYNLGKALAGGGRYAEAAAAFESALRAKPADYEAHRELGAVLARLGKLEEAVRCYRAVLEIKPDDGDAARNLADTLVLQGRADDAILLYRRILAQGVGDADVQYRLGVALAISGNWDEAIEHYTRALELAPENPDAEYNLGYALKVKGRVEEATSHFNKAIRIKPEFPLAHFNLACVLAETGRREEAISHLQEAVRVRPDYQEALQKLRELDAQMTK